MLYNHYMYIHDNIPAPETERYVPLKVSPYAFPITVDRATADELSVEEVGASMDTLGPSYSYFMSQVPMSFEDPGLLSVNIYDYKSICFNITCVLAVVYDRDIPYQALALMSAGEEYSYVLCIDAEIQQRLSEAMCEIGASPIVKPPTYMGVRILDSDEEPMDLVALGIKPLNDGEIHIIGSIDAKDHYAVECEYGGSIEAVRTAVVTVSIVLKPVSMHGGVRPSTKEITYVVHNVLL